MAKPRWVAWVKDSGPVEGANKDAAVLVGGMAQAPAAVGHDPVVVRVGNLRRQRRGHARSQMGGDDGQS
jgi:hypothetical protein